MADDFVKDEERVFRKKTMRACPNCGKDILLETAWDGSLRPLTDKCDHCGYPLKPGFLERIKRFLR